MDKSHTSGDDEGKVSKGNESVSVMEETIENGDASSHIVGEGGADDKQSHDNGVEDVVMTDETKNGGEESSPTVAKSEDSPDDEFLGGKSELVVLDEVEESLDDKDDDNNDTISASKQEGPDDNEDSTSVVKQAPDDNDSSTSATKQEGSEKNDDSASATKQEGSEKNDDSASASTQDPDTKVSSTEAGEDSGTPGSQDKKVDDPYAYVKREDFTSEKYKIEIRGLPKFYGYGELKKLLNDKLKLASHKMKPTRNKSLGVFVCFKNEEDRQAALKKLNRLPWKGKLLSAVVAKPAPDPLVKKRKLENEVALNQTGKKPRLSDDEKLRNSTTPYWKLPYDEQLQKKNEYVMKIMCKLADQICSVNPMLSPWMRRQKAKYDRMACKLLDIRKSPVCDGYRNKCEFTIGINEETNQRMVGFRLGSYVQGHVGVGPIDSLKHIPQRMKETVKVFEKFIKESKREPFSPETHMGHWRQLTLRLTTLDELMAVVLVNSRGVSPEELELSKGEVKSFFEEGEGKDLKVDSLYFQAFGKREAGKELPKMEHLLGSKHISESILGLKFRISPEAFFQVNTPGAGILYSTVGEIIELNAETTILDVCCGTGTIGLSLAKDCGQVLGLEVVAPAIEDAKVNAAENNITNVEFFTGRAEEILTSVLTRAKGKAVHAIVDPPRSGLQQKAIVSLRGAEVINKVIYVSCDPNAAMKNFVDLARITSKVYHGYPLVPVTAIPVDMFPHTAHCEVVILFHRINPLNLPKVISPDEDDIEILSKTLLKPPQSSESDKNVDGTSSNGAQETGATGGSGTESSNDNKNSEGVDVVQEEGIASGGQQAGDKKAGNKLKPKRKNRSSTYKLLARCGLGFRTGELSWKKRLPPPKPPKIAEFTMQLRNSATKKLGTTIKRKIGPKGYAVGSADAKVPLKFKPGTKNYAYQGPKMNYKVPMGGKNFNPKLGDPPSKRKWKKDMGPPMKGGLIVIDEDMWLSEASGGDMMVKGPRPREGYPRRGQWKDHEGGPPRDVRGGSPPPSRANMGRRGGGDEAGWMRSEDEGFPNWMEERERHHGSPPRKLMRRGDRPELEVRGGGRYNRSGPNFREEWVLEEEMRPGPSREEEEGRFERMRPGLMHEPDEVWRKRRQRRSLSPIRRYEDDEFVGRMADERWGSGDGGCAEEGFRRRKYGGEVDCGRPNIDNFEERHSRRSCERFSRGPEMVRKRSSDRSDRFPERFERRSMERYDRRSSERFDHRSPERFSRGTCERCDRRPSEKAYRLEPSMPGDDFDSRPKRMLLERETMAPRYAQQHEHMERFDESQARPSCSYRDDRHIIATNERKYLSTSSPPRKMVEIVGSVELHRKNEVVVYRGPNDALPRALDVDGRLPVGSSSADNRASHYEKRFESSILHRNYDGEEPRNDHNVIARRVEVIRRPFMVDEKYGMILDTSGKSLGTAEVLLVTAKNQTYDEDHMSQFNPNEGVPSRILEQSEMSINMCKPWGVDEPPHPAYPSTSSGNRFDNRPEGHSGRPQGNWALEREQTEMPRSWDEREGSNSMRNKPNIPDADMAQFNYSVDDVDDRQKNKFSQSRNAGTDPNGGHNLVSYPIPPQSGYGAKAYSAAPKSQFPPKVPSLLANKIPEPPRHPSQNAPFSFASSSNSRMPVPPQNLNIGNVRPALLSHYSPNFMGPSSQGNQQMSSFGLNQPAPGQGPPGDNRQRMPTTHSDSRMNTWNFREPWRENNRQSMPQEKRF